MIRKELVKVLHGVFWLPHRHEGICQIIVCSVVCWVYLDYFREVVEGILELLQVEENHGLIEVWVNERRVEINVRGEAVDGAL